MASEILSPVQASATFAEVLASINHAVNDLSVRFIGTDEKSPTTVLFYRVGINSDPDALTQELGRRLIELQQTSPAVQAYLRDKRAIGVA